MLKTKLQDTILVYVPAVLNVSVDTANYRNYTPSKTSVAKK